MNEIKTASKKPMMTKQWYAKKNYDIDTIKKKS